MNDTQRGILTLVKSAVTGQALTLPEGFAIDRVLSTLREHQLVPLAYQGAVNCGLTLADPGMQPLLKNSCNHMLSSEGQLKKLQALYRAFDEQGIDYMPVKGCIMKPLYPRAELRPMSDADILIRLEQYDAIKQIVSSLGFQEELQSDHELVWRCRELKLELHKRLIPSYNKDYFAYFGDGWQLAKEFSGTRAAMTAEDAFIYLFVHLAKHYRDGGIGIRHVVDLWVYLRAFPGLDDGYIRRELSKLSLREFYDNLSRTLAVWFEDAPEDGKTHLITEFIFASGSWGRTEQHLLSAQARQTGPAEKPRNVRLSALLRMVFPPAGTLKYRYGILERFPVLLPVFWVIRWFEVLLFRRDKVRLRAGQVNQITAEKVRSFQQSLHYVGLDFRFED